MSGPKGPNRNEWFSPSIVLTIVGAGITAFAAYNTFSQNIDKRVQRLEDRTDVLWSDWLAHRGRP